MLAGSVASVISRFCVAPLDVLKIRFQIQEQASHQRQYTSVAQAFKSIYKKEGIMVTNTNTSTKSRHEAGHLTQFQLVSVAGGVCCACRRFGRATLLLS